MKNYFLFFFGIILLALFEIPWLNLNTRLNLSRYYNDFSMFYVLNLLVQYYYSFSFSFSLLKTRNYLKSCWNLKTSKFNNGKCGYSGETTAIIYSRNFLWLFYETFMNFLWKFFMTDAFLRKFSSFLSSSSTKHLWRATLDS